MSVDRQYDRILDGPPLLALGLTNNTVYKLNEQEER